METRQARKATTMYSKKSERANKVMTDAVVAGVTYFAPGATKGVWIEERRDGTLLLAAPTLSGEREQAMLAEVAGWAGVEANYIAIKKWLNTNY
jgi:hypothetical protein